MANKLLNRARMTVSGTPGTGTITLNAAATAHQSFSAAGVADGDVVGYLIEDGTNWEIGRGAYTASGTTLARSTILASSNGGAAINASSAAQVTATLLAEDIYDRSYGDLSRVPPTGIWTKKPGGQAFERSLSYQTLSAGYIYYAGVFYIDRPIYVTDLGTIVNLGQTSATGIIGIYSLDGPNNVPDQKICEVTGLDFSAQGLVSGTVNQLLQPGAYCEAVLTDTSSVQQRAYFNIGDNNHWQLNADGINFDVQYRWLSSGGNSSLPTTASCSESYYNSSAMYNHVFMKWSEV